MSELMVYSELLLISSFVSAVSQIMLKMSAGRQYESRVQEYTNPLVMMAYALFFGCTFLTMYSLKVVPLSMAPILEASGYIFVALLSRIMLKERISRRKLMGLLVILLGICIYSL